ALHNSPPILVADAKVRQAQAELNEVRLGIARDITLVFQRYTNNKALRAKTVATEHAELEKLRQAILEDEAHLVYLLGAGTESGKPAERAELPAKVQQAAAGGGMGAMMGPMGSGPMPGGMGGGPMGGMGMGGMAMGGNGMGGMPSGPGISEKIQKFLQSRVDLDFENQPLDDVLTYLEQTVGGDVRFVGKERLAPSADPSSPGPIPVTVHLEQVTVEVGLQALADLTSYCFIFRDYGILVTHAGAAGPYIDAGIPMIGRGAATLERKP
ncbi:MAG TPA: hypothetical protein PK867_12855, partial [Pirellulales bacterium]|nr:hypothetical protein [Pirellulales bacterium]